MLKNIFSLFTAVIIGLLGFVGISGAQTMNNDQVLNAKQQSIATIAAFTAQGELKLLEAALSEGLNAGLSINEIKEVLVQMYAYCGFPRSLNGINTLMHVLQEREQKGIHDEVGKEANPLPMDKSKLELGIEIQTYLIGTPATGAAMDFSPAIDLFLKEHLFGDIFGRDNLDFKSREIATIAALASMNGVESQLLSHLSIGMNIGLTEAQLQSLVEVLRDKVGASEADNMSQLLNDILNKKGQQ